MVGRVPGRPASAAPITATGVADRRAAARRSRWEAVSTCSGFWSAPVAATTNRAGSVSDTSNRPYSR